MAVREAGQLVGDLTSAGSRLRGLRDALGALAQ
jgi:hypothetical protein